MFCGERQRHERPDTEALLTAILGFGRMNHLALIEGYK